MCSRRSGVAGPFAGLTGTFLAGPLHHPSPALTGVTIFLTGFVAGLGIGAIIRGSLTVAIAASGPDDRAGTLTTFFTAGYVGISLPVIGIGLSLQHLSFRVTLLIFGTAAALVILAAAPTLVRPVPDTTESSAPASDPMAAMCCCFSAP